MDICRSGTAYEGRTREPNTFGAPGAAELFAALRIQVEGARVHWRKTYDGTGGQTHSVDYAGELDPASGMLRGRWHVTQADWYQGSFNARRSRDGRRPHAKR